jgi:hypothetical protein
LLNSDFLAFKNKEKYHVELSKLATMARWLISAITSVGLEDLPSITEFIGEYPTYREKKINKEETTPIEDNQEVNQSEQEWIEWAKKNGFSVIKTSTGIKIRK